MLKFPDLEIEEDGIKTDREEGQDDKSDSESDHSDEEDEDAVYDDDLQPIETLYTENKDEELGQVGVQPIETLYTENKDEKLGQRRSTANKNSRLKTRTKNYM